MLPLTGANFDVALPPIGILTRNSLSRSVLWAHVGRSRWSFATQSPPPPSASCARRSDYWTPKRSARSKFIVNGLRYGAGVWFWARATGSRTGKARRNGFRTPRLRIRTILAYRFGVWKCATRTWRWSRIHRERLLSQDWATQCNCGECARPNLLAVWPRIKWNQTDGLRELSIAKSFLT